MYFLQEIMKSFSLNWEKYSEEEIHFLIKVLFSSLGYNIKDLHKSDRANEDGADILVEKEKERIAIAVKVKPGGNDRPQVIELSKRKELKKIYIYSKTPTTKFREFMKEFDGKIDFWDYQKLNNFFKNQNPYLMANLLFEESDVHLSLDQIKFLLFTIKNQIKKNEKEKIKEMDKDSLLILWRLKDISVTIHKTNKLIFPFLLEPMNFKDKNLDQHFLNLFLDYLERLDNECNLFIKYFIKFYEKNKKLVENSFVESFVRSHWIWIANFKPINDVNSMKSILKKSIEDKELLEKLEKELPEKKDSEKERYWADAAKSNSIWKAMEKQVGDLYMMGMAIEYVVDDIMNEYLGDPDSLIKLQSKIERGDVWDIEDEK